MPVSVTQGVPTLFIRREAYERSGISRASLDARLGLTDAEFVVEGDLVVLDSWVPDTDGAHTTIALDLAREAGVKSIVLLKNEPWAGGAPVLPLSKAVRSVAVIGPLADSSRDIIGPWVFDFDLDETVTVLDGIRARAGDAPDLDPTLASGTPHAPAWRGLETLRIVRAAYASAGTGVYQRASASGGDKITRNTKNRTFAIHAARLSNSCGSLA